MSEVHLKAQRDLSIAGDVVGRDKITINITRGLDELPTRYDSRVQNFLEYYLGAKDYPAPFGGRAFDLAALDAWLNDPAAPPRSREKMQSQQQLDFLTKAEYIDL